jgi:mannonate dehydratase
MSAISAVDIALWDIKAKALNVPVYQLLGGASRDGVLVYGHASGADIEDTLKAVSEYVALGYKAIRAQSGIPGLQSAFGVGRGRMHYEPAQLDAPTENLWSTEFYLEFVPKLFERLRREFGPTLHLLHDAHHRLTPIEAAHLGKSLEPHHLFWLEDPVPSELQESYRLIRRHTTTPLAVGEVFDTIYDCQQLIQEQLIDYVCTTVVHAGGISHLRKMAAALHFDLSVPNFGIQEHMPHCEETNRVFPHSYNFAGGMMFPGDKPGLGVDIDEDLATQFPYRRAYLPVNRKLDGTMHITGEITAIALNTNV